MPALPSFISYRRGKKAKAAIMAPFSLLRGDSSTASSSTSYHPFTPPDVVEPDVIDINHSHYPDSRDPSASFEQDVFDNPRSSSQLNNISTSPQVELDIDLSSNGLSDWLEAFSSGDPKKEALAKRRLTRLNHLNIKLEQLKEGEGEADRGASSSEDMITGLQMDAESDDLSQESSSLKHPYSISIPESSYTSRQASRPSDLFIGTKTIRPLSSQSDIASSAISGTTIARALMSNSFILSTDRSSLYRNGAGAGLTRTDSATLPNWEWNSRFSVGSDAPPIPSNAELLYEPPRRLRNEGKRSKQSSTSSLSPKTPLETPPISSNTRLNSVIVNGDVDNLETILPETQPFENPLIPRLPPRLPIDEAVAPDQASPQIPVESQVLSQDSDTPSSLSSGQTSPKELEGLLNYYSIPDSPELLLTRGFRPMFSPITEESSSQLSPPTPYRSDKRDSQTSQPVGGRSPLRARDSTVLPMKDSQAEGAQSNIASESSTTISDSSFYVSVGDDPDVILTPPQPNKIVSRERSASIPIKVVRNSRDLDAYNLTTASSFGDATLSGESPTTSQEFPETPDPFSPMLSARPNAPAMSFQPADDHEGSLVLTPSISAVILESDPAVQLLPKQTSVQHSRQGSLSKTGSTSSSSSGSLSIRVDISESPEPILSPNADDASTEDMAPLPSSTSESSSNPSNLSLLLDASKSPDPFTSLTDPGSPSKSRVLPSIPMVSPHSSLPPDDELTPASLPGPSTISVVLEETVATSPSSMPSSTVNPSGRLPTASTISNVSGGGHVAVNGSVQEGQHSAELESQQTQHDSPGAATKSSLTYRNETYRTRASDIFRGTSLGSPPPYYSVVSEAMMQENRVPNIFGSPFSLPQPQGSDNIAGPSSGESSLSNDIGRPRENFNPGQRTRARPPLPAGPRRPSQSIGSPGPRRGSFSSISSSTMVPDSRIRQPPARFNNPTPSPSFEIPTPKWKGYTMEVAKWTFTSAQLQAIVSKAIRQSAESSSIRLLRLEILDNEIPEEIKKLEFQRTNIKMRFKATTRRRATILDSMYSSLGGLEDVHAAHRLTRQLDELKELTLTLDRLTEELHSVDQQISYLECLTHIHNASALSMALRKINTSFLQKIAENQVLKGQVQSLEAERDEAWHQAQSVANEYDQINDNTTYSPSPTHSSRVSAKRKSCIRLSRAGLRTPSRWPSQRSSGGGSASATTKSPPPLPLLINRRHPMDILIDSPRSSNAISTSGITPTSEARALAEVQDELYSMLGILNPERAIHRSRSEIISPISPRSAAESPRTRCRRDSLPGALSLTEAYNVMAVDRNAVLATIDMLKI